MRIWLVLAGLSGAIGVALGAYSAHGLGGTEEARATFRTAVQYQMWHVPALLAVAWLSSLGSVPGWLPTAAGVLFSVGVVLFSGSLYAIGLGGKAPVPMAAPLGGLLLMAGWLAVGMAGLLAART